MYLMRCAWLEWMCPQSTQASAPSAPLTTSMNAAVLSSGAWLSLAGLPQTASSIGRPPAAMEARSSAVQRGMCTIRTTAHGACATARR